MYRCSDGGKKRVCPEDGRSGEHISICEGHSGSLAAPTLCEPKPAEMAINVDSKLVVRGSLSLVGLC